MTWRRELVLGIGARGVADHASVFTSWSSSRNGSAHSNLPIPASVPAISPSLAADFSVFPGRCPAPRQWPCVDQRQRRDGDAHRDPSPPPSIEIGEDVLPRSGSSVSGRAASQDRKPGTGSTRGGVVLRRSSRSPMAAKPFLDQRELRACCCGTGLKCVNRVMNISRAGPSATGRARTCSGERSRSARPVPACGDLFCKSSDPR
jgi:hypothetical protein